MNNLNWTHSTLSTTPGRGVEAHSKNNPCYEGTEIIRPRFPHTISQISHSFIHGIQTQHDLWSEIISHTTTWYFHYFTPVPPTLPVSSTFLSQICVLSFCNYYWDTCTHNLLSPVNVGFMYWDIGLTVCMGNLSRVGEWKETNSPSVVNYSARGGVL